jgi:hypothetical protein
MNNKLIEIRQLSFSDSFEQIARILPLHPSKVLFFLTRPLPLHPSKVLFLQNKNKLELGCGI